MSRAHFLGLNRVFSLVVLAILFQVLFHSGNKFFSCFWRDPTLVPYVDFENVSKFMTFWFALAKPPLKNSRLSSTTNRCDWHFAQHFDIETFSANICRTNSRDKARSLLLHRLAIFNWRSRDNQHWWEVTKLRWLRVLNLFASPNDRRFMDRNLHNIKDSRLRSRVHWTPANRFI